MSDVIEITISEKELAIIIKYLKRGHLANVKDYGATREERIAELETKKKMAERFERKI